MRFKKRTALVLLMALSILTVAACSDNAADNTELDTSTSSEVTLSSAESETEEILDAAEVLAAIPDTLPEKNMDGWQFRMTLFGTNDHRSQTWADEFTGSMINDAVYQKIIKVEDRFNVEVVLTEASFAEDDNVYPLKQAIIAGDDSCELAQGHDIDMANASLKGYFVNVYDLPHLNFEKPWWPYATLESMTVLGQMYMMFNNISYNNLAQTRVVFFNKDLMNIMNIALPYDTVYEGKWTLDELKSISDTAYIDLNGDSTRDVGDQYGYASGPYYYGCMEAFNVDPYCKDENGGLYYNFDLEKISALAEKYYNLLFGEGGFLNEGATSIFMNGRAMFLYERAEMAIGLSNTELTYGILPMPKLDEIQEHYYGGATDRPLVVPITVQKDYMENIGIVIEDLNAEGYKNVYPAFYEIAMKNRYADQTDDAKMLDIIHDNVIISFTYLFGNYSSAYNTLFNDLFNVATPNYNVASWDARKAIREEKRVQSLMEFFTKQLESANP